MRAARGTTGGLTAREEPVGESESVGIGVLRPEELLPGEGQRQFGEMVGHHKQTRTHIAKLVCSTYASLSRCCQESSSQLTLPNKHDTRQHTSYRATLALPNSPDEMVYHCDALPRY
jgi:hypothetical protein